VSERYRPGSLLIAYGQFAFRTRNWLFPLVLVPCCLLFPPIPSAGLDVLGILVSLSGLALRAGVIGFAYIKRGGIGKQIAAPKLVTEGMFAHGRNPLYLGNLLVVAGLLLIHNSPWTYLIAGAFFLISYAAIVAAEEAFLRAKFGAEYEAYCARTPRWLVDPRNLRQTLRGMGFNWRRVVAKDYGTQATWLLSACLLLIYGAALAPGPRGPAATLLPASLALVLGLAAVLYVRRLKKSGRLQVT